MPSWQWSYPFNDTDTGTVLFDAAPADALCHWRPPHMDVPVPRQRYTRTGDGRVRNYEIGTAGRRIVLQFSGLPVGDDGTATSLWGMDGIKEFLLTHAEYGQKTFGFYDDAGSAELEVRYVGGIDRFVLENGVYRGAIELEEEVV